MVLNRWWLAAALVLSTVLAALLLSADGEPWQLALGLASIAVFLIAWAFLAKDATDGNRQAIAMTMITIVVAGAGTASLPNFAIFQCLAFPLVWVVARSVRNAIIANVAVALAVGIGFMISRPLDSVEMIEITFTVLLSLAFSIVFGLWITRIATLSEERQELLDELQSTQAELEAVSRDAGVTSERERLAREIHDTIAQELTGMVMLAQRARLEPDAAARAAQLTQLEETAREALTETRALIADGAPASLDAGLVAALERLTARFSQETGITVTLTADDTGLDRTTEVVVLRCTQEALSNVRKHSGATAATVTLERGALTVTDDGHGFDPDAATNGYGLTGMRDRLALVGGRLELASGASGTTVRISLAQEPVPAPLPQVQGAKSRREDS
jgi:signal transduction histidine kinase